MKLCAIVALLLLGMSQVQAQLYFYPSPTRRTNNRPRQRRNSIPNTAPVVLSPEEQAAKAQLDRMVSNLNRAEGVTYTGNITYSVERDGKPVSITMSAVTTLERTAKISVQVSDSTQKADGFITADGSQCTLYDAATNRYMNAKISPDLYSLQEAMDLGAKQLFPSPTLAERDLHEAIAFPMLYFSQVFEVSSVPAGETLSYSSTSSTSADGKPVLLVSETLTSAAKGSVAATYMVDSETNLPLQFTQIETRPGRLPVTDLQETFKDLHVVRSPLPNSTYTPDFPAGARLVTAAQ